MKEFWNDFERWLAKNWPAGLDALNPPASNDDIANLEAALGCSLPRDFVECLQIHNGQDPQAGGLLDNTEFLSTERILDEWTVWNDLLIGGDFNGISSEPAYGVKDDWWNPKWIPFTYNGSGDHHCIDLDPAEGGSRGQVITMWHDMGDREILGKNFSRWFAKYVNAVLEGKYAYSEDYGGLISVDEL